MANWPNWNGFPTTTGYPGGPPNPWAGGGFNPNPAGGGAAYPPWPNTAGAWPQQPHSAPVSSQTSKYPTLNPILASDVTRVRFDVRNKPSDDILSSTFYSYTHHTALRTPTQHIRLLSPLFPWTIDVVVSSATYVTPTAVWESIYQCLQQPLADSEWGCVVSGNGNGWFGKEEVKFRERVEGAMKKRLEKNPSGDKRPLRVDWLGDVTLFKGLEKDPDLEKLRLFPGTQAVAETWVIKLTS